MEEKADQQLKTIPKTWDAIILTKGLSNFNKILQEAAENNCKMITKRVARDPNPWRTDEIRDKKKSVGMWKHRFHNHQKPVFQKLWKRNQYEYNNMIKKARA